MSTQPRPSQKDIFPACNIQYVLRNIFQQYLITIFEVPLSFQTPSHRHPPSYKKLSTSPACPAPPSPTLYPTNPSSLTPSQPQLSHTPVSSETPSASHTAFISASAPPATQPPLAATPSLAPSSSSIFQTAPHGPSSRWVSSRLGGR